MKKFYDTCSLLLAQEKAFDEPFIISIQTLQEIEHIKTDSHKDEQVKFQARRMANLLDDNSNKYEVSMLTATEENLVVLNELCHMDINNDLLIIFNAYVWNKGEEIQFVSDDVNCKVLARKVFKLNVTSVKDNSLDNYKGYVMISGDSDYINDYISNTDYSKWYVNEYLIFEDTGTKKFTELKYNGESFVPLKLPSSSYVKAKNSLQRCALDLLMDKNITAAAILGGYGSGKTFLATQMALYSVIEKGNQSKVLGIRECSGEGKDVGYLKGTFEDKTGKFFKPIEQQLKGGEFELESLISRGVLETNIPFYLKGTTYNDTVMVVDEAEDLSESQIRLIGTRLGENSKVYFSGDYSQSLFNKTLNNPLVKMCNLLKGNSMFGCIVLDEDVRSQTSKLFANLFKN